MIYLSASDLDRELHVGGPIVLDPPISTSDRVTGTTLLIFWIVWMVFGVGGVGRSSAENAFEGFKLWIAFLVTPPALLIYGMWAWIDRLTLNPQDRTYGWEKGFYPFRHRRNGRLDEFQQVEVVQQRHNGQSGNFLAWKLIFSWKQPRRTAPTYYLKDSRAVEATIQRLSERLDLPLVVKLLKPGEKDFSKWVAYGLLGMFACCAIPIFSSLVHTIYEGRGPRFPTRAGQTQTINLVLGDFTARTLEARLNRSEMMSASGNQGGIYYMKDYTLTVDIENTSSRVSELQFIVGFTGATRQTMSTGRMKPGEHREMTASFHTSDNTDSVFLRPLN